MDSPQITAQFSEASKLKCANHLMLQPKFSCLRAARISRFFRVNCKLVACKTIWYLQFDCNDVNSDAEL